MNNSTVKFKMKAGFTVESYLPSNEKYLKISILDLTPEYLMDLSTLERFRDEIHDWDIYQDDLECLNLDALDEEKEYEGGFDVELEYWSTYDNWSGATEYDASILLTCNGYKENNDELFTSLEWDREYSKIFHAMGNKDADSIFMKLTPSGKIHLEFSHCCVRSRGHFIDVTTLTRCLAEHLFEYRKKEDE